MPLPFVFRIPSHLVFLAIASICLAATGHAQPLVNQTGQLPVRINGPVEMKFAIVEVETNPSPAYAKASVVRGAVAGLTLTQAGDGYETVPQITLVAPRGSGARARATIANGRITGLQVIAGGQGYTQPPEVRIARPTGRFEVTTLWSNDGTSVAGSQPTQAVTLNVVRGTYSALLGYTGLPNMTPLPAAVLAHLDARLRVWYRNASGAFIRVLVDAPLQSTPYADTSAFAAGVANGSITAESLAAGAVTAEKLGADTVATGVGDKDAIIKQLGLVEAATPTQRAIDREVWLAVRTDGRPGSGTADDPYDASTAAKFDTLMRGFADVNHRVSGVVEPISIHLFPSSTYLTMGNAIIDTKDFPLPYPGYLPIHPPLSSGWQMYAGWRLYLHGATVKLAAWPTFDDGTVYPYSLAVITSSDGSLGYAADDSAVIGPGTVDCNWQNLAGKPSPSPKVAAVILAGDRVKIKDVHATNSYGNSSTLQEVFTIAWGQPLTGEFLLSKGYPDNRRTISGGVIEGCLVDGWQGDYGVGIGAFMGDDGNGGLIFNNEVVGYNPATCAYGGSGRGLRIIGNRAKSCSKGVYVEGGQAYDCEISSNVFLNCRGYGISFQPPFQSSDLRRFAIRNNVIELDSASTTPWAIHAALIGASSRMEDIIVEGNTVRQTGSNPNAFGINMEGVTNLKVINNTVSSSFTNNRIAGTTAGRVVRDNQTESGAVPKGLEDYPANKSFGGDVTAQSISAANSVTAAGAVTGDVLYAHTAFGFLDGSGSDTGGYILPGRLVQADASTVTLDWTKRTLGGGAWSLGDGGLQFTGTGKAETLTALGLRQHTCSLNKTGAQTMSADGVFEKLTWDTVLWDYNAMGSIADDRLMARVAGIYRVDFRCTMDDRRFNIELYKNGAPLCSLFRSTAAAANASVLVELAADDYVEVWAASSGGLFGIAGSSGGVLNTTFSLTLVREN